MIDPNYYDSFLKNIPPEESVNGLLGLAESLEKHFIDYFTNVITEAKEILIKKEKDNQSVKEIDITINSWKDKNTNVDNNFTFILGKDYVSPLDYYPDSEEMNKSDCFLTIEVLCKNEEIAQNIIKQINLHVIPRVEEFAYYNAYKKLNGCFKFFTNNNRVCLCLGRKCTLFNTFVKLINSLQLTKFNFGITTYLNFKSELIIAEAPNLSIEDFLSKLLVFKLTVNGKLMNYTEIVSTLIELFNKREDLVDLSTILTMNEFLGKLNLSFDIKPDFKMILDYLLNEKFESREDLDAVYKILQDNISITFDLFPIIIELFQKIGINTDKSDYYGIIFSLCSSELRSKLAGEFIFKKE